MSVSASGLVTISGVAANTSSIATITTTRTGYLSGSTAGTATTSLAAQVITWNPETEVLMSQSTYVPTSLALATYESAAITYQVVSTGTTGCSVNSSSGVLSYERPGACVVKATSEQTSNYSTTSKNIEFIMQSIS